MQQCNENAANRYSYVGEVYNIGEKKRKNDVLNDLPEEWSRLHKKGYIHIHDLDAYGLTYNCLTFNILKDFPFEKFALMTEQRKILATFDYLRKLFVDIGNEQSGGMAIANFDNELAYIFEKLGVSFCQVNKEILADAIYNLIVWCSETHTRMGQTSYYVSLNIGLAKNERARFIAFTLIDEFEKAGDTIFKPNIIFKIKEGVNRFEGDKNHDLLKKALLCSAKKMIPTYVLCDSEPNKGIDPEKLAIMGCRTRVVADLFGENSSIGRGNIDNISINLPRLALETDRECHGDEEEKFIHFCQKWDNVADITKDILLDRFDKVCARSIKDFPTNSKHHLWIEDFEELRNVFRHGTLSIGFIGLSEAMEVLTGHRYYEDFETRSLAVTFVRHMREYCDKLRDEHNLNFSLLATSGELISGRFTDIDMEEFSPKANIFDKGFYTNSFHINVDSTITSFEKIAMEGVFHNLCNGGCITYVELGEAPIGNVEGLLEYIEQGVKWGTHYLGFNFPKDICNVCNTSGVFDKCCTCGSDDITRIRRVSGYLEVLEGFTKGKKNEEKNRRPN